MIGLDTNVLVRAIVADDTNQTKAVRRFLLEKCTPDDPGFVNLVVLCELAWTLKSAFQFGRADIVLAIGSLLNNAAIAVEAQEQVSVALERFGKSGLDFPDLLIAEINRAHGCSATFTFDRKASKLDGFHLLS